MSWLFPKLNTEPYEKASKEYEKLAKAYTGEEGQKKAVEQASKEAKASSSSASASATNQALNSGYSRAKAARMGQNAGAQQYSKAYDVGYQNAVNMNNQRLNAQNQILQNRKGIEEDKYRSNVEQRNAVAGAIGNTLAGVASAISDENCKEVIQKTPEDRIAQLKAKLEAI